MQDELTFFNHRTDQILNGSLIKDNSTGIYPVYNHANSSGRTILLLTTVNPKRNLIEGLFTGFNISIFTSTV